MDGFNFKFIKASWDTLKKEVLAFVMEFHNIGTFPRCTDPFFIALIPKVEPIGLEDYSPISLIDCMYKIVAKMLAKRLKKVLRGVIDLRQSAFVEGMNLLHSVIVAHEVVDEAKRRKNKILIFKVDCEKINDLVPWKFLWYMLQRLGFCEKWISWKRGCATSSLVSIL